MSKKVKPEMVVLRKVLDDPRFRVEGPTGLLKVGDTLEIPAHNVRNYLRRGFELADKPVTKVPPKAPSKDALQPKLAVVAEKSPSDKGGAEK